MKAKNYECVHHYLEEFLQIVELSVYVSTHCNWGVNPLDIALLH